MKNSVISSSFFLFSFLLLLLLLLFFSPEVCVVRTQAAKSQELGRRDAVFCTVVVRGTVVLVRVGMDDVVSFSLFQGNVHVSECD